MDPGCDYPFNWYKHVFFLNEVVTAHFSINFKRTVLGAQEELEALVWCFGKLFFIIFKIFNFRSLLMWIFERSTWIFWFKSEEIQLYQPVGLTKYWPHSSSHSRLVLSELDLLFNWVDSNDESSTLDIPCVCVVATSLHLWHIMSV